MKKRFALGALLALFLGVAGPVGLVNADPNMTDPTGEEGDQDPTHWYDRDGVLERCLDWDPELGCLYAVEHYSDGYVIYVVDPNHDRKRFFIPDPSDEVEQYATAHYPFPFRGTEPATSYDQAYQCADGTIYYY